jgi:hypothetical protein
VGEGIAAARPGVTDPPTPTHALHKPPVPETARLYASDWAAFVAWCQQAGATPLPAAPATVAAYLAALPQLSPGALARRCAAIAHQHRQAGLVIPAADPAVRSVLRTARRAATPRRAPAPSPATLVRLAAACPGDLAGLRDRALLLLMAEAGLGRRAVTRLTVEQVRFTPQGLDLAAFADDTAGGAERVISVLRSREPGLCPVRALEAWLHVSDTRFGPLFRKVDRWGNLEYRALGADAVRRILARRATRSKTPPAPRAVEETTAGEALDAKAPGKPAEVRRVCRRPRRRARPEPA